MHQAQMYYYEQYERIMIDVPTLAKIDTGLETGKILLMSLFHVKCHLGSECLGTLVLIVTAELSVDPYSFKVT